MKPKLSRQGTTQLYSDPTATTSSVRTQLSSSSTVTRMSSVTRLSKSSSVTRSSSQVSRRPSLRTSVSSQPQIQKSQTQEALVTQHTLSKSGSQASVTDQIKENGSVLQRKSSTVSRKSSLTPARTTSTALKMKRKASSSAKLTPVANKRARKAPTRFANLEEKQSPMKRKAPNEEQKILHYRKGDFLAVKSDEDDDGFYLCKAIQNVFKSTKQFMIQWLNKDDNTGHYSADYCDFTELDCIIVEVKLDRQGRGVYSLPAQELSRIQNALQGQLSDEEEESVDEPKVKKAKLMKVKQGEKKVKTKAGEPKVKKIKVKEKVKKEKKEKVKKEKKEKPKKEKKEKPKKEKKVKPPKPVKRKGPNRKLVPNPNITVLDQDPLYYSRDRVPFVSPQAHSKLVFRAVFLKDKKLLKEFINDIKSVSTVSSNRSGEIQQSPLNYAIKMRDLEAATMLIKEQTKHRSKPSELRIVPNPVLLHTISTGSYNPKSLGLPAIRPLAMSRGCREGNNAFSKDPNINYFSVHNEIRMALIEGLDLDFINKMLIAANQTDRYQLCANVHYAVRAGHRKLAGRIIEEAEKTLGPANFNFLHKEVLLFDSEDLRPLRAASVMKKAGNNDCMLPIHCACINPNVKYLSALMSVCPEYDMPDKRNRRPVHYAAACETTATLEYLVSHGARTEEFDTAGMTPLMIACETGRMHNVEFLLKKAKDSSEKPEDEGVAVTTNKFGIGQINRPNKQSYTALHIAIKNGRLDIMKKLLEYGADIKRKLSAGKNRMTPLMIACEAGDFEIIKYLNELNVPIEQTDKLGRTALIHAVLNGHAHIASFLLSLGADPKASDTSGNSCIHYAVAYGWYHCFKLLLEAGADPNQLNDWKMQPLSIAFLKGHRGFVDLLLEQPGVDINFPDERGMTLLAVLCSNHLTEDLKNHIQYLVTEKKADCTIKDINGNTCLHHLANQTVANHSYRGFGRRVASIDETRMSISTEIAALLLKNGCGPNDENNDGVTPMKLAFQEINVKMMKLFVKEGGVLETKCDEAGKTALHHLAEKCVNYDLSPLIKDLVGKTGSSKCRSSILSMAKVFDDCGYTPLMVACLEYSKHMGNSDENEEKLGLSQRFIQTLIDTCQSDVNATVRESKSSQDSNSKPKYGTHGKQNVLHMVCTFSRSSRDAYLKLIKLIMKYKPDVDNMDYCGHTVLIRSIENEDIELFRLMIKADADVNRFMTYNESEADDELKRHRSIHKSLLLQVARRDNEEMIKTMLDKGADITAKDEQGNTALHLLCMGGRKKKYAPGLIKRLLDMGCGINDRNNKLRTPFHLAVNDNTAGIDASTEFEEFLIDLGADLFTKDVRGRLPLHYAFVKIGRHAQSSTFDPIELCSNLCLAMRGKSLDLPDHFGKTPLHYAAYRGATVCCMLLLKRGAQMEALSISGNTPLGLAVYGSQESCAMMLIQREASISVNITPDNAILPSTETVQPAVEKKKDEPKYWFWKPTSDVGKNKTVVTWKEYSLFQACVWNGWQGVIYLILDLLDKFGLRFAQTIEASLVCGKFNLSLTLMRKVTDDTQLCDLNKENRSLVHILTRQTDHNISSDLYTRIAEVLYKAGVSLTSPDDLGMTPLHYAVLNNHTELVRFILDNASDLDINQTDEFGRTALASVYWRNPADWNEHILNELMKKKASLDILVDFSYKDGPLFGYSPVKSADYYENHPQVKISPLIFAILNEEVTMVKQLLKHGASVSFADENGQTPLMHAIMKNNLKLVQLLVTNMGPLDKHAGKSPKSSCNVSDKAGNTALHYVVKPLPRGSFDNTAILQHLLKAGADVNIKNSSGLTPLQLALTQGSCDVASKLQQAARTRKEKPVPVSAEFEDGIEWDDDTPDCTGDAAAMLEKFQNEAEALDDIPDPLNVPDPQLKMDDTAEVVQDTSQSVPYSILMTKIDVSFGAWGLYNFYKMQIVRQKGKDLYILFNRWGRIGDVGNFQQTPFPDKEAAIKEFCKIFKSKTKNDWEQLDRFENHWGKYRLVRADERKRCRKLKGIDLNLKSDLPSKLPQQVQGMLKEVTDVTAMHRALGKAGVDMSFMPFGHIKKEALQGAIDVLNQLKTLCKDVEEIKRNLTNDQEKLNQYHGALSKICKLTNEYYHQIPQSGFQYEKLRPLDNERRIDQEIAKIHELLELEFASKVLAAAQYKIDEVNPLDYVYRCMDCSIFPLEEDSLEAQYLLRYIHTSSRANIECIFRVCRQGEEDRIRNCGFDNNMLLFHGSNTCNLLSILHRGLLIAPTNAQITGHMFGKGIYTSDVFAKSVGYCYNWGMNAEKKFMLLCEVALGKPREVTQNFGDRDFEGNDCTKGVGRTEPDGTYDVRVPTGEILRLGELVDKTDNSKYCVNYNEYIVYKEEQVRLRYIIQFK